MFAHTNPSKIKDYGLFDRLYLFDDFWLLSGQLADTSILFGNEFEPHTGFPSDNIFGLLRFLNFEGSGDFVEKHIILHKAFIQVLKVNF